MPNYNDVKKVEDQPGDSPYMMNLINQRIANGWILLNVYAQSVASDYGPCQTPRYVLGWTGEGDPPDG